MLINTFIFTSFLVLCFSIYGLRNFNRNEYLKLHSVRVSILSFLSSILIIMAIKFPESLPQKLEFHHILISFVCALNFELLIEFLIEGAPDLVRIKKAKSSLVKVPFLAALIFLVVARELDLKYCIILLLILFAGLVVTPNASKIIKKNALVPYTIIVSLFIVSSSMSFVLDDIRYSLVILLFVWFPAYFFARGLEKINA